MHKRLGPSLYQKIFPHLSLNEILLFSLSSNAHYFSVARYLHSRLHELKGLSLPPATEQMSSRSIFKLFKHHHCKKLVVFRSLEYFEDELRAKTMNSAVSFYPGLPIDQVEFSQNYAVLRTLEGTHFLGYSRGFFNGQSASFCLPNFHKTFIRINSVKKFSLGSKNFVFLDEQGQLQVRFFSNGENPSQELELRLWPQTQPTTADQAQSVEQFALSENYLIFSCKPNSLYLIDGIAGLQPEHILEGKIRLLKIEIEAKITEIAISNANALLISEQNELFQLAINKTKISERLTSFAINKNAEALTLRPSLFPFLKNRKIRSVVNSKNLFLIEEAREFKRLEELSPKEVCEFLISIEIKGLEKTVLYNNVDGKLLASMDEAELDRLFDLTRRGGKFRLLDAITIQRNKKTCQPGLFIFGSNQNNQFGISSELNYVVELDLPKFDPNESVKKITVGWFNALILTSSGRAFIAAKNAEADPKRRRFSSKVGLEEPELIAAGKIKKDKNEKKGKREKGGKIKEKKNKEKFKPSDKKKFDWLDLREYLARHCVQLKENEMVSFMQAHGKNFYLLVSEVFEEMTKFVFHCKTAKNFIEFLRANKHFEPEELLFFHESDKTYYPYRTMLAFESKLSDVKLVKRKKDNFVIWSKGNPHFDIRSVIN